MMEEWENAIGKNVALRTKFLCQNP
jgi:hypothetical protein